MRYFENVLETIGNTPLVRLTRVMGSVPCLVLAKLEMMNPDGSVKDRIGQKKFEGAEKKSLLRLGPTTSRSSASVRTRPSRRP